MPRSVRSRAAGLALPGSIPRGGSPRAGARDVTTCSPRWITTSRGSRRAGGRWRRRGGCGVWRASRFRDGPPRPRRRPRMTRATTTTNRRWTRGAPRVPRTTSRTTGYTRSAIITPRGASTRRGRSPPPTREPKRRDPDPDATPTPTPTGRFCPSTTTTTRRRRWRGGVGGGAARRTRAPRGPATRNLRRGLRRGIWRNRRRRRTRRRERREQSRTTPIPPASTRTSPPPTTTPTWTHQDTNRR
mmetsp:Transcript_2005/g.8024  ORF Transcript_2005/g.8024 Transcript_2005/m.8024 type:complete len:244 (+) Transcript_2005:1373-2104(+)